MMKRSKMLLSTLLVFALFLAACGEIEPQPTAGLTRENAGELSNLAINSQGRLLAMMPGGNTGMVSLSGSSNKLPKQLTRLLPQRGLSALSTKQEDCVVFKGDFTDADKDEIPVNMTFTFNCTYREDGKDVTVTGSASFKDADDNDALSGYIIKFTDFTITETKDGKTNRLELDQTFVLEVDNKGSYLIENDLALNGSTPEGDFVYTELATLGYKPDNVADPFAAGTFALNSVNTWQSGKDVYKLTGVAPALHYNATCESSFDKGTVKYEDNFGNALELTFNACNNVTVIYNGSPI